MVKDIFFEATRGKRNIDNYCDGMLLIEMLADKNMATYIRYYFDQLCNCEIDAEGALARLVDMAYSNSCGANGYTETSKRILAAYHRFF